MQILTAPESGVPTAGVGRIAAASVGADAIWGISIHAYHYLFCNARSCWYNDRGERKNPFERV